MQMVHEAFAPDLVLIRDLTGAVAPEATRCRTCEGTGMVQCDACLLADSACDACGEPAAVLVGEEKLPFCLVCDAIWGAWSDLFGFVGGGAASAEGKGA